MLYAHVLSLGSGGRKEGRLGGRERDSVGPGQSLGQGTTPKKVACLLCDRKETSGIIFPLMRYCAFPAQNPHPYPVAHWLQPCGSVGLPAFPSNSEASPIGLPVSSLGMLSLILWGSPASRTSLLFSEASRPAMWLLACQCLPSMWT